VFGAGSQPANKLPLNSKTNGGTWPITRLQRVDLNRSINAWIVPQLTLYDPLADIADTD
jgi:hypothetical protein